MLATRPLTLLAPAHLVVGLSDGAVRRVLVDGRDLGLPVIGRSPSASGDELAVVEFDSRARIDRDALQVPRRTRPIHHGAAVVLLTLRDGQVERRTGCIVSVRREADQVWIETDVPVSPGSSGSLLLSCGRPIAVCQGMAPARGGGTGTGIFCALAPSTLTELAERSADQAPARAVVPAAVLLGALVVLSSQALQNPRPLGWTPVRAGLSGLAGPRLGVATFVRDTAVDSTQCRWQESGVTVAAGDLLTITASGEVTHWRSASGDESSACGPEGTGTGRNVCDRPASRCCLSPGLPDCSLVGKIGEGEPFYIGPQATHVAEVSGTLFLGMNETAHCTGCADNAGSWRVRVVISQP